MNTQEIAEKVAMEISSRNPRITFSQESLIASIVARHIEPVLEQVDALEVKLAAVDDLPCPDCDKRDDELGKLCQLNDQLVPLVEEVELGHRHKDAPEYNECDSEPCFWCEKARAALAEYGKQKKEQE